MAQICIIRPNGEKLCSPDGGGKGGGHHHRPGGPKTHTHIYHTPSGGEPSIHPPVLHDPKDDDGIVQEMESRARKMGWTVWDVVVVKKHHEEKEEVPASVR